LEIANPRELEQRLNNLPAVVTVGIGALRPADVTPDGAKTVNP
jgi:ribose 5-phosphate isomerase A